MSGGCGADLGGGGGGFVLKERNESSITDGESYELELLKI